MLVDVLVPMVKATTAQLKTMTGARRSQIEAVVEEPDDEPW